MLQVDWAEAGEKQQIQIIVKDLQDLGSWQWKIVAQEEDSKREKEENQ